MNEEGFRVLRCEDCGDTFPAQGDVVAATCPSCGSGRVVPATEPLL
jgi:Zn finger protein HypA/HybF involved in hydrogenase expression